ncbi:MAG: LptF/LptG family permease [Elusimicrobiota bacterium]|jgi:lipopolysaccharide export system permease protein
MPIKIIDRYQAKGFFAPFGICTGIFSVMVIFGRYFEKMDIFNNYHAKLKDIVVYLLLGLPFWLNMVLPVATMLALLFSLGHLQQRGELTAMRSAGIGSLRLYAPYFMIGLALSVVSLIGGLSFLPKLNFAARAIYRVHIKQGQVLNYRLDHVVAAGSDNRRFTIGWLDVEKNEMREIVVDQFTDQFEWLETIAAKQAVYRNKKWVFLDGTWRHRDATQPYGLKEEPFQERIVPIPEAPADFLLEDKMPDDMTGREILRRIKRLRTLGASTYKERVALHLRLALPFANVVVIALGIPFAIRQGHKGRTQTFSYALGLAFLYWGMTSICQSFGEQGRIPPWIAAWASNISFSALALGLLRKTL